MSKAQAVFLAIVLYLGITLALIAAAIITDNDALGWIAVGLISLAGLPISILLMAAIAFEIRSLWRVLGK